MRAAQHTPQAPGVAGIVPAREVGITNGRLGPSICNTHTARSPWGLLSPSSRRLHAWLSVIPSNIVSGRYVPEKELQGGNYFMIWFVNRYVKLM
jgi:hypothetical protein